MIQLVPLIEADPAAIERLLDQAFGTERRARTAYRIRDRMTVDGALSVAAIDGDALVGSLQTWPCALHGEDGATPLILVGPVAVAADRQGEGIGTLMMRHVLDQAEGREPLVLIGDPGYYGRFGFSASGTANWGVPGPVERWRLLVRSDRPLPLHGMLGPRI
ncbi:GNAT family N-acetyltransferase [Sphingomonas sp.]|uniref:GNAT family N-acetyltransferase n=1 Tax=Sphingomonas sp. TaxID=28214 RepID=UPI003B3A84DF